MPTGKRPEARVQKRGSKRMRELGMKQVVLWFNAEELGLISDAANGEFKKVATWIRTAAYHAAEEAAKKRRAKPN